MNILYPTPFYYLPADFPIYPMPWRDMEMRYPIETPHKPLKDYGKEPLVINIHGAAMRNNTFRTTIWTGDHLQVVVMSIPPGEDIGLEAHPHVDQFLRLESGEGLVQMGKSKNQFDVETFAYRGDAIVVPAGTWHNLTNIGNTPIKLYTIYAPPNHPFGTVEQLKPKS